MRSLFLFPVFLTTLQAEPIAGAWEGFPEETHVDSWNLFSFDDEWVAPPLWAGPETEENPYAYSFFLGGDAVWFFADTLTANGVLVGDYAAQKILGIDVSVSIDPAEIDFIDLAVLANGPNGWDYYVSNIYTPDDLGETPDWYALTFRFDETWFAVGENDEEVPFLPDQEFLASIQEVGLRAFTSAAATSESFIGIDDFILVPSVESPPLSTSVSDGSFQIAFTPNPGVSATIETLSPGSEWIAVDGQSDLTGPQTFSTPVGPARGLFRVVTEEKLTPVEAP